MRPATSDALRAKMQGLLGSTQGEREIEGALLLVDIGRIHATEQPRQTFAPDEMAQLVASIRELRQAGQGVAGTGILQPILVRPVDSNGDGEDPREGYLIKAGERRFRAAREVGLAQVPVIVQEDAEDDAFEHALIENIIRHDLSPLEEGIALSRLMEKRGYSVRETAKRLGKSKSYVTDRLEVLRAGEDVRAMVSARADTLRHAREIDKVEDPVLRRELIRATVEDGASFKEIQERIGQGALQTTLKTTAKNGLASPQNEMKSDGEAEAISKTDKAGRELSQSVLRDAVKPAGVLLAEAIRQIESAEATRLGAPSRELKRGVAALKNHIDKLEEILKQRSQSGS